MHRRPVLQAGLILWFLGALLGFMFVFVGGWLGAVQLLYLMAVGVLIFLGLGLAAASTFLPQGKEEKPTFTEELLGRERLQYGNYAEGNWKAVLDEKERAEKERRKR